MNRIMCPAVLGGVPDIQSALLDNLIIDELRIFLHAIGTAENYLVCPEGAMDFIVGVRKKLAECLGGTAKEKGLLHNRAFLFGLTQSSRLGVE